MGGSTMSKIKGVQIVYRIFLDRYNAWEAYDVSFHAQGEIYSKLKAAHDWAKEKPRTRRVTFMRKDF